MENNIDKTSDEEDELDAHLGAYGRPSYDVVPYGQSENDGYDYIPGHAPNCSGPSDGYPQGCWCAWIESGHEDSDDW